MHRDNEQKQATNMMLEVMLLKNLIFLLGPIFNPTCILNSSWCLTLNNKWTMGQFSDSCIWLKSQEKTTYPYKHESENIPIIKKWIFGVSQSFGADFFLSKYVPCTALDWQASAVGVVRSLLSYSFERRNLNWGFRTTRVWKKNEKNLPNADWETPYKTNGLI
jgi:hypothetical protein